VVPPHLLSKFDLAEGLGRHVHVSMLVPPARPRQGPP
jgi:hypothetical protein